MGRPERAGAGASRFPALPPGRAGRWALAAGAALVALALAPGSPGRDLVPGGIARADLQRVFSVGGLCDSCPDPNLRVFGVEFRQGDLWTVSVDGTLAHLSSCQVTEFVSVQGFRGFATGLGYDSRRDLFVVADALLDTIDVVDLKGTVVRSYAAPGTGSIGAAYDARRDVYWITDFEEDSLFAVVPETGAVASRFALPAGFRVSGAAYDPVLDAIYYQSRVADPMCYMVSAANGALLGAFSLPYNGVNGWEDNALAPNGTLWIHHFELRSIYCVERLTTAARRTSWGALKALYR